MILSLATIVLGAGCESPLTYVKDRIQEKANNAVTSAAEQATEQLAKQRLGQDVDVNFTGKGVALKGKKDGQIFAIGEDVAIPEEFPADVPRYPGAKASSVSVSQEKQEAAVLLETGDARKDVRAWLEREAVEAGWNIEGTPYETVDSTILFFLREERGGKAHLTATVSVTGQGKTSILMARQGVK